MTKNSKINIFTVKINLNESKAELLKQLQSIPNKAILVKIYGDRGITNFGTLEFEMPK